MTSVFTFNQNPHINKFYSRLFFVLILIFFDNLIIGAQCSGTIWDSGGSGGNYPNNANTTVTYTASAGSFQRITFTAFNTEAGFDLLKVYNGPNTSSPLLGTYSGTTIPPVLTATGTTLTLKFTSDASGTAAGWTATLSCVTSCSNTTVGGTIEGVQTVCGAYNPTNITSSVPASGGSGTLSYQWESSSNGTVWADIAGATSATYDPSNISSTTHYRRKSQNSGCSTPGASSNVIIKTVAIIPSANAGIDKSQCQNSAFQLIGNVPSVGENSSWSVVSGTAITSEPLSNDSIVYCIGSGLSSTLRYTVSNGICNGVDDIVITNTTACSTSCNNQVNQNGDLENEGNATTFPLLFQSTPAAAINSSNYVPGCDERYGSFAPDLSNFTGSYYIKKTGVIGEPHSGSHMIYLGGSGYSFSTMSSASPIACGKVYKFSAWVAAFTNGNPQTASSFKLEIAAGGPLVSTVNKSIVLTAPASASWNDLNWQRYELLFTIPSNDYLWNDFYFTPLSGSSGIVIDDICITHTNVGSTADAGEDILNCSNNFNLGATSAAPGYSGSWTVVSGSAAISSPTNNFTTATINSGNLATLRWTVEGGACVSTDEVVISYTGESGVSINNAVICEGSSATLSATNCTGSVLWSNGATTSSISVAPTSTSSYIAICTAGQSPNLALNSGFESDLTSWNDLGNSSITNVAGEVKSGLKAVKIDGTSSEGGLRQDFIVVPGESYSISFYAKMNNTNASGMIKVQFIDDGMALLSQSTTRINSTSYQKYTISGIAPISAVGMQIFAMTESPSILFVDDIVVQKSQGCSSTAMGNVVVQVCENCINNNDDDGDGLVDCDDADCDNFDFSYAVTPEITSCSNTFSYQVCQPANAQWISHWDLGLPTCITATDIAQVYLDNVPAPYNINVDPACGIYSLKWINLNVQQGTCATMKVVFKKTYEVGTVDFATKAGQCCFFGTTTGPLCEVAESVVISGSNSICLGNSTTLTASGTIGNGITYLWSPASSLSNATIANPIASPTSNTVYTVTVTNSAGCSATASYAVTVITPNVSSTTPASRCGNGTVLLKATTTSGTLNWYANASGGLSLATGTNFTTPSLTATTTYYVASVLSGCSTPRIAVTATLNPIPTITLFTPASRCGPGTVNLNATASAGIVNWYSTSTGGTNLGSGTTFTTPSISSNTTYYAEAVHNGCVSAARTPILATINTIPSITSTSSASRCGPGVVMLGATASAGTISWFATPTGGVSLGTGTSFTTPSISSTTNYYVETSNGICTTTTRSLVTATIIPLPSTNIIGPSGICIGQTTSLSPNSGGTWVSSNPGVASINNNGLVTALSNGTSTFTFTSSANGCISIPSAVVTVHAKPIATILGSTTICVGSNTSLTPSTGGSWTSSNLSVATINNNGVVSAISAGTATFTYTQSSTGCSSDPSGSVTINAKPIVSIFGPTSVCVGSSTTLSPSSNGTWSSSNNLVAAVDNNGIVTGIAAGIANFIYTLSATGCSSLPTNSITVNANPSTSISYSGAQCLTQNSSLTANSSGGTTPYSYSWTGPNSFTASSQTISVNQSGSYNLTITDNKGCIASANGFMSNEFIPQIVTLQSTICEGKSINLTANGSAVVSYLWSANAANATTAAVNVTPVFPSSTYTVTVTNNLGCTASVSATINVIAKPSISLTGPSSICISSVTNLTPTSGGIWSSNNPTIAAVNNAGIVSGVNAGTATFIYTSNATGCKSATSIPITVYPKPAISIIGPTNICIGSTTSLLPSSGGTWFSSNPTKASITPGGVVTGISGGPVTFTFINGSNGCFSNPSGVITVDNADGATITGDNDICVGESTVLSVDKTGGQWVSSNTSIATISQDGVVNSLAPGLVTITYDRNTNCETDATFSMTINAKPAVIISGPSIICAGSITSVSPVSGGSWISSNPLVATITNGGLVTGISSGTANFVFTNNSNGCESMPTNNITVLSKPAVDVVGQSTICNGSTTQLLPNTNGVWASSNASIASVNNSGLVTALSNGKVTFEFTSSTTGCTASLSDSITIRSKPNISLDFHGTQCFKTGGQITANVSGGTSPYTFNWSGPSFTSNMQTITLTGNGAYHVTVNDSNLCSSNSTAIIYAEFQPIIVSLQNNICEGQAVNLNVNSNNASYHWSSNANNAITQAVTVYPAPPTTMYTVTVTNSTGCTAIAQANINVNAKPVVNITGPSNICINGSTSVTPGSGGIWSSSNPGVASITHGGNISALAAGSATFTFTNSTTGCTSNPSSSINIGDKPATIITGPSKICVGGTTTLMPSTGGIWTSTNPTIATINNSGQVTAISPGTVNFVFSTSGAQCVSDPSLPVTVNNVPSVAITGLNNICIGQTTSLSPSSGGSWISSNPGIATVTNSGIISALQEGVASFTYKETATNCFSEPTLPITINPKPVATLTGDNTICVGQGSSLSSNAIGTWLSSDPNIAIADNTGHITSHNSGQVTFTFTSSQGCTSYPSQPLFVNANPYALLTGSTAICFGGISSVTPQVGGVWVSSNPTVASVNNAGIVEAVGAGQATFTFTETTTGCVSNNTAQLLVYGKPNINITGPNQICIGSNTTLTPSLGGIWLSLNPSIANINNQGVVTGLGVGTARFLYTESASGCISDTSSQITINNKPIASIEGPTTVCVDNTSNLLPTTGGTWISNNPSIASVSNNGTITALAQGVATFTFIQTDGCTSNASSPIIINGKPVINLIGSPAICIGSTTQLFPSSGGSWHSPKPGVATITNGGLVTGVSTGFAKFIYTDSNTGCKSDSSTIVQVNGDPFVSLIGASNLCEGSTTNVFPSTGGVWTSSNNAVVTVSNSGLVTGVSPGQASLVFTNLTTGCSSSLNPIAMTVNFKPVLEFEGANLCEGDNLTLTAPGEGSWVSRNPSIASINNNGLVTALGQGVARMAFTNNLTGCTSNNSEPIIVNNRPIILNLGSNNLCIGSSTQLFVGQSGFWINSNPEVASIDISGNVTALTIGSTSISFLDRNTECMSENIIEIIVSQASQAMITGPQEICLGYTTQLSPEQGGIWQSNDDRIATVNNSGLVTGRAPGKTTFTFIENGTGCITSLENNAITVKSCTDADFNVGLLGIKVKGNVKTNDDVPATATYGDYITIIKKPETSSPNLIMNSNGGYEFTTLTPGVYIYKISVCMPPIIVGCPSVELKITILDQHNYVPTPVANIDFTTVKENEVGNDGTLSKWLNTLYNDKCPLGLNCTLEPDNVTVEIEPGRASTEKDNQGKIKYRPNIGHIGMDTLIYKICTDGTEQKCEYSKQIITTNAPSAINTTVASDDFEAGYKGNQLIINLLENDSDAESDSLLITTQGSQDNPVIIPEGKYFINEAGILNFEPSTLFYGAVDIVYTICDNNETSACASATAHLLIMDDLKLKLRVYLEGAIIDNNNEISSIGRPLMRDDLRNSPFTNKNYIPVFDPYKITSSAGDITSSFNHVSTQKESYANILDSTRVFSVSGENAIVDWVFVEIRSKSDNKVTLATRSGLLQRDGDIVDIDGESVLSFTDLNLDSFYVVVRHRNHLGVMSLLVSNGQQIDFTSPNTPVFDFGANNNFGFDYTGLAMNTESLPGYSVLWAGDANADGKIKFTNPSDDLNPMFFDVFAFHENLLGNANFNFTYGYYQGDFNLNGKTKFDNPNDDKNLLYGQILFYRLNSNYLSNFNYFIEQIP